MNTETEYICDEMSKSEVFDMLTRNPRRAVGLHPQSKQIIIYGADVSGGNRSIQRSASMELNGRPITRFETLLKLKRIGLCTDRYETEAMIRSLLSDMTAGGA